MQRMCVKRRIFCFEGIVGYICKLVLFTWYSVRILGLAVVTDVVRNF